jgi:acetyl esterase/lipase
MGRLLATIFVSTALALLASGASQWPPAASDLIALWPKGAPGGTGSIGAEVDTTQAKDELVGGGRVIRLSNVINPTITIYRAPKHKDPDTAMLVFPGGGYQVLALDLEGTEICAWLNSLGITSVLVKYRVPVRKGSYSPIVPLQDAQRALGLVRYRSGEWHLDPGRIGVIGFSAGGHLAATLATNFEKRTYEHVDEADAVSCRPDFELLIYPAYLTVDEHRDRLVGELAVTQDTPPTFLVQTEDDVIGVENGLFYFLALKNAKVPAEMHLFASGNHGYGLRLSGGGVSSWPKRAEEWLHTIGALH